MSIELMSQDVKGLAGPLSDLAEAVEVGAQDVALEGEVHELPLARGLDEAGGLQLLDVVREGRGAHLLGLVESAARGDAVAGADLLEDLHAARLGQGARDARELPVGENVVVGGRHESKLTRSGTDVQTAPKAFDREIAMTLVFDAPRHLVFRKATAGRK
jgi:hypothetical protein